MQDKSVKRLFKEQINHYSRQDQSRDSLIIPLVLKWVSRKKDTIEICEFGGEAGQLLNEIFGKENILTKKAERVKNRFKVKTSSSRRANRKDCPCC